MFKLIDITFHANTEYSDTSALLKAQQTSLIYIDPFKELANVEVIKHYCRQGMEIHNHPAHHFFAAKNYFGYASMATMRWLKNAKPDIVLVRGLIFPLPVLYLRLILGKKVKIIAVHHADRPFRGPKRILQKLADKCINAYFFTSKGNAKDWIRTGIINNAEKIFERPATLTRFKKLDKQHCRQTTGMPTGLNYLWVGRLNSNKDPLTLLIAFQQFLESGHSATLHLAFQTNDLLAEVKEKIAASDLLLSSVVLHGKIDYQELPAWFSASDYFISTSHSEGGSSVILEAMACGCIPIVSRIPPSMKVIEEGIFGLYFSPGNPGELLDQLINSCEEDIAERSASVEAHYTASFSPSAIASQLHLICNGLLKQ